MRVRPKPAASERLILTIGHSTRPIEAFIALLQAHGVTRLIDIRTVPRSRHNPQFGREQLPDSLAHAGIGYTHSAALGGLRRPVPNSPNSGWRNLSFRGYADHMQSAEFAAAIEGLIGQATREQLVLMCAEAVPWRCHRSLVADALLVRGVRCEDIRSETTRMPHRLTRFARVHGTRIVYPPELAEAHPEKDGRCGGAVRRPRPPAGSLSTRRP